MQLKITTSTVENNFKKLKKLQMQLKITTDIPVVEITTATVENNYKYS